MMNFFRFIITCCCLLVANLAYAEDYRSIMYQEDAMQWLDGALKAREKGVPIEIVLPELFPSKKQVQESLIVEPEPEVVEETNIVKPEVVMEEPKIVMPTEAPSYYLRSIMYFSPDNWTIWLNDTKISSKDDYEGLRIIAVDRDKAAFMIEDSKIEYIYPEWEKDFYEFGGGSFASNNKNIVVDIENQNISFVLGPNQSFVTKTMSVVEGPQSSVALSHSDFNNPNTSMDMTELLLGEEGSEAANQAIDNAIDSSSFLRGHNPADGVVDMQQYLGQLNMLKSALDSAN